MKLSGIAVKNISRNLSGTLPVFFLVMAASFLVFVNTLFSQSMKKGLRISKERLGADIIVVPAGFVSAVDDSLFKGIACTVTFDSGWKDKIAGFEGVEAVSTQLYVASLGASPCCEGDAQLIAIDPENDFTVGSWMGENRIEGLTKDEAIAGSGFGVKKGETIKYYGREYTVKAVLDESGMGYDSSIFISYEAAQANRDNPLYSAQFAFVDNDKVISMVLVKKSEGADTEELRKAIEEKYGSDGISAYAISSLIGEYSERISSFGLFGGIFEAGIILLSAAGLFTILSLKILLRKNEIGTMLSLGLGKRRIAKLFLMENGLIYVAGSICGTLLAAMVILPFTTVIKESLGLPYCGISLSELSLSSAVNVLGGSAVMLTAVSLSLNGLKRKSAPVLINEIT